MKRILVNLKDYQHEQLRKFAFDDNKSISEHVRKAVDIYIKMKKGESNGNSNNES